MTIRKLDGIFKLILPAVILCLLSLPLTAQRAAGEVGIGAQFGAPTGLTVKVYQPTGISVDVLAAWDLDNFFFVNVHGLIERHIDQNQRFHWFIGPGVFAGIRNLDEDDDLAEPESDNFGAGISGTIGLNYIIGKVEIFGQFTPRLELLDETNGDLGGGLGFRVYID